MTDAHVNPVNPDSGQDDLPEQMRVRREKRDRLLAEGVQPYPISVPRTHLLKDLRAKYDGQELEPDTRTGEQVSVAGRVIFLRNTGKLCFVRLREGDGTELQVMLSVADLGDEGLTRFKQLVDIGDLLSVQGEVITSRRGELSVQATSWQMAAKTLRPLPNEHKPLNEEARVRLRYVDLIVRPEARDMVRNKAAVLKSLRATFDAHDFIEVETPVLQLTNGGAAARPFSTHLNAFDQEMKLRIALELDLKRAMIGGVDRVFEIGRTFRNEGLDSTHAAEFSMIEAYEAYGDYDTMAELFAELMRNAGRAIGRTAITARDGSDIDLEQPFRHATLFGLVSEAVGETVDVTTDVAALTKLAEQHDVELQPGWNAGEIAVELFEKLVEHTLIQPTFVRDYPESARPLAKPHRKIPGLVEAWDLIVNGVELGTAYSELNDPVIQRERLVAQSLLAAAGDPEAMELDEDFLRAMEFGMPPAGGMGMGLDRLVMLFTGAGIRETILFPLLRPE
ncbi:lysine--tRNA ligase [Kribbella capetownensis]|uniref:Lysine--tRNA ligase n=1 Tax=Kribbella capetownensis TaxID=1572659 RepID=A0A4V2M914_9ACTN|nr:lysine--tRNA ligase [Kribbella capetownensis]TCC53662.1 lysine--tRNA ligase [Kribbella capetownensis]